MGSKRVDKDVVGICIVVLCVIPSDAFKDQPVTITTGMEVDPVACVVQVRTKE